MVKYSIKNWAEDDRPREKLVIKGRSALSDAELLAILIRSGSRDNSALDLGKAILRSVDSDLNKLALLPVEELTRISGIGEAKAVSIIAAMELARRKKSVGSGKIVRSSQSAYEHLRPFLMDLPHEEFWVLCLNRRMKVLKTVRVSVGGINGTLVDPRIVFRCALQNLSNTIVLCHNHPSGSLSPSEEDILLTKRLQSAADYLGIKVADHLIFTNHGYYSFADNGVL